MISNKIQKYQNHPDACIISCYFNSNNYISRLNNFNVFYQQLRRSQVNYLIAECAFGDVNFTLPNDKNILRFRAKNRLWQKERLLNLLIKQLPSNFKYIFWLDADVLFTNPNWLIEAVQNLETNTICQPFSLAVRLEKDEIEPSFNVQASKILVDFPNNKASDQTRLWRSFAYNYCKQPYLAENLMFDIHGHTGFAWGARREVLKEVPLFDKAIVGTADHLIAHAAVGQIPHNCIEKAFLDNETRQEIYQWSRKFNSKTQNRLGFVEGEVWHLWHGNLKNRQYLQRTQQFSKMRFNPHQDLIKNQDGLYEIPDDRQDIQDWMDDYFESRREDDKEYYSPSTEITDTSNWSNNSSESKQSFEGFGGGGDFAGAGAGGSWENYS